MIRSEIEYQRALEQLEKWSAEIEGLPWQERRVRGFRPPAELEREREQLIGDVCRWILNRPRSPGLTRDFVQFLKFGVEVDDSPPYTRGRRRQGTLRQRQ